MKYEVRYTLRGKSAISRLNRTDIFEAPENASEETIRRVVSEWITPRYPTSGSVFIHTIKRVGL